MTVLSVLKAAVRFLGRFGMDKTLVPVAVDIVTMVAAEKGLASNEERHAYAVQLLKSKCNLSDSKANLLVEIAVLIYKEMTAKARARADKSFTTRVGNATTKMLAPSTPKVGPDGTTA